MENGRRPTRLVAGTSPDCRTGGPYEPILLVWFSQLAGRFFFGSYTISTRTRLPDHLAVAQTLVIPTGVMLHVSAA